MDIKYNDSLQADYRSLSNEAKKKFPLIKEASENSIVKLRECRNLDLVNDSLLKDLLQPFSLACETNQANLILSSLLGIQKLINYNLVNKETSSLIVEILTNLVKNGIEEIRILQTTIVLLTANTYVTNDFLSKSLVNCFSINSVKVSDGHSKEKDINITIMSTAAATIRQLISVVFERVLAENQYHNIENQVNHEKDKAMEMSPALMDAYHLFQDLCLLANGDKAEWLKDMPGVSRTFALELLEAILAKFNTFFLEVSPFFKLVKDKVCPLVIKLFSPNVKYNQTELTVLTSPGLAGHGVPMDNGQSHQHHQMFSINLRLLRIVGTIIRHFHQRLVMECEIFMAMLIKFIDPEKPEWLRVLALETLNRLVIHPPIVRALCRNYDTNPHSSKIFSMLVEALDNGIQSKFAPCGKQNETPGGKPTSASSQVPNYGHNSSTSPPTHHNHGVSSLSSSPTPFVNVRGVSLSLTFNVYPRHCKILYLELLDKSEAPTIPEGCSLTLLLACLVDLVMTLGQIVGLSFSHTDYSLGCSSSPQAPSHPQALNSTPGSTDMNEFEMCKVLIEFSWCNILSSLNIALEMSESETLDETITKNIQYYAYLCGTLGLKTQRNAFVMSLCKESLPYQYAHTQAVLSNPPSGDQGAGRDQSSHTTSHDEILPFGDTLPNPNPSTLTPKNMHCMRALLNLIHCYGNVLESFWDTILPTLLHLIWVIGLKPASYYGTTYRVIQNEVREKKNENGSDCEAAVKNVPKVRVTLGTNVEPEVVLNQNVTSASSGDINVIQNMLLRLFETTDTFTESQLMDLLHSLVKLSNNMLHIKTNTPDAAQSLLFPLAKISEVCHVNLPRLPVFWDDTVVGHLCRALVLYAKQGNNVTRDFAGTIICSLVKHGIENFAPLQEAAASAKISGVAVLNPSLVLSPMLEIISKGQKFPEARLTQLNTLICLLRDRSRSIIFTNTTPNAAAASIETVKDHTCLSLLIDTLGHVPLVAENGETNAISKVDDKPESVSATSCLATAFQCIQLLINDFLLYFSPSNIEECIIVVYKFAAQNDQLNISLTAIGLLWNIADYLHQNSSKVFGSDVDEPDPISETREAKAAFKRPPDHPDVMWMCLYTKMAELCLGSRSPVRKSACQTLFSTVDAHGSLMNSRSWHAFVWEVLFPLLDQIRMNAIIAPKSKDVGTDKQDILIHHSRDTQSKQWAETQVLAFEGIARIFCNRNLDPLKQMDDFTNMWTWLLHYVQKCATTPSSEISTSALKCFRELIDVDLFGMSLSTTGEVKSTSPIYLECFEALWQTWLDTSIALAKSAQIPVQTIPTSSALKEGKELTSLTKRALSDGHKAQLQSSTVDNSITRTQKYIALATCTQLLPLLLRQLSAWPKSPKIASPTKLGQETHGLEAVNRNDLWINLVKTLFKLENFDEGVKVNLPSFSSLFQNILQTPVPKESVVPYATAHSNNPSASAKDPHANVRGNSTINPSNYFSTLELTPVQDAIFMSCVEFCRIVEGLLSLNHHDPELKKSVDQVHASLVKVLLHFAPFMWRCPGSLKNAHKSGDSQVVYLLDFTAPSSQGGSPVVSHKCEWVLPSLENFGSKCARLIGVMFLLPDNDAKLALCMPIIKCVEEGLDNKQSLGKHSCTVLWETMHILFARCLPILTEYDDGESKANIYDALLVLLQKFLFNQQPPSSNLPPNTNNKSIKNSDLYRELEVKTITHIVCRDIFRLDASEDKDHKLRSNGDTISLPQPFIKGIINILARGSIYTELTSITTASYFKPDSSVPTVKDKFMAVCFDTICRLALSSSSASPSITSPTSQTPRSLAQRQAVNNSKHLPAKIPPEAIVLAISLLLTRCHSILKDYLKDEEIWGKCPLPRMRLLEITSSLTALTKLLAFIKQNDLPSDCVNEKIWEQITELYTVLVDCMLSNSRQICTYLQGALRQYSVFLSPPLAFKSPNNSLSSPFLRK